MKKLKVLIAGTDSVFCDLKKIAIELWQCDVIAVPDGKQACAAMLNNHVDICILDWNLAKMTGLEACRWMRLVNLQTQPYILMLTEKDCPEQVHEAYLAGANDYLSKPFSLESLHFSIMAHAQKLSQMAMLPQELTQIDPLELYRRDLAFPVKSVRNAKSQQRMA
ncbi:MAG TPA: response regulator [Candidatus Angelobacter sp.]|nr:response regulator [Candidatus Angelobacter sp.]